MQRLIEDYKETRHHFLIYINQAITILSRKKKTRDIETLNICLFYLIFENDLS